MPHLAESIRRLIVETSTNLPPDVRRALARTLSQEAEGTHAALALHTVAVNVDLAAARSGPICQDTGMPIFQVRVPVGADELRVSQAIGEAVAEATALGKLRPNSVDSLTGRNSGDNRGPGTPVVHFEQWLSDEIEIRLLLKGGGCENMSAQYSLPCELPILGQAERDLDGVRRCLLHAVHTAQGQGCSAGVLGVAVGGDRASGYDAAERQLFRTLDDANPDDALGRLEEEVVAEANALGIGTMGFGGAVTLLGCKIAAQNRLPASFFVSVAYQCWALRRLGVSIDGGTGEIKRWLYGDDAGGAPLARSRRLPFTGREVALTTPLGEKDVRRLKVGDVVLLSGVIHTGRDALHKYLMDHDAPWELRGAALYHCGPVSLEQDGRWTVKAAGPTTSSREEPYEADVIRKFGIRAVIGKGGMGERTLLALREHGAVYLSAVGGAAQYYAECIEDVIGVDLLELGVPEAMWHLRVKDLPAVVTMDAHGASLHRRVEDESARRLVALARGTAGSRSA